MKNLTPHKVRSMFVLSGVAAMMGVTMMAPQAARADKEQNYKIGATALGVLGVVLAAKGKTLPAVIAGAGAYYAYEKGKDAKDEKYDDRYNDYRWNDNRYDRNNNRYGSNDYYRNRYDSNNRYDRNNYNDRYDKNDHYDKRYDSNHYDKNRYDNRYDRNRSYSGR